MSGEPLAATAAVKLRHFVLISGLMIFGLSRSVVAQTDLSPRTALVYVTPSPDQHFFLSQSEHLLVFQMPVQVPGVALPAGAYVFRLLTPSIVQIMSANRLKMYATLLTIPDSGPGDTSRERIKFEMDPEDDRPRIVGWYLPDKTGLEFLYPKPKRADRRTEK